MPAGLLAERRVRPRAKLLFGSLQTLPGFMKSTGEFTYASLSAATGVSTITLRQLVKELAEAGWIGISQTNQLAPVRFTLRNPEQDRAEAELAKVKQRLQEAGFRGEAIMKEYLSLLIDSNLFRENARPDFLVKPLTEERMELDRYYPPVAGFEFNGLQHDQTTHRFDSQEQLAKQQARDLMKEALCARHGVRLVVVRSADLNLETMRKKVGTGLPLRDLTGLEELVRYLVKVSKKYWNRS